MIFSSNHRLLAAAAVCLLRISFLVPNAAAADTDRSEPPGEIKFVGSNRLVTAPGTFRHWKTTKADLIRKSDGSFTLDVHVEVDVASIDTGNSQRDNHLRSADFFHVSKYPTANLRLYDARPKGEPKGNVQACTGKLDFEMHGRKKSYDVTFELVDGDRPYVKGKLTINRNHFGVGAPHRSLALLSVYDNVSIRYSSLVDETTSDE